MTLFGETGFVLGPSAFDSSQETLEAVLHEMYRLKSSTIAGTDYPGGADSPVAQETEAARSFAARAYQALASHF